MTEQLLNLTEVKQLLVLNDEEVMKLVREGKLNAFKIGGTFLRFDKNQVLGLKARMDVARKDRESRYSATTRIVDFLKFYGIYIITVLIVGGILYYFLAKG
ncbi:MAG: hypothetical protein HY586_01710 [Candidatus Omnitrophica bacterium]|nr:hypothetical protein [Candidatus Omnitrophota bacterium]